METIGFLFIDMAVVITAFVTIKIVDAKWKRRMRSLKKKHNIPL